MPLRRALTAKPQHSTVSETVLAWLGLDAKWVYGDPENSWRRLVAQEADDLAEVNAAEVARIVSIAQQLIVEVLRAAYDAVWSEDPEAQRRGRERLAKMARSTVPDRTRLERLLVDYLRGLSQIGDVESAALQLSDIVQFVLIDRGQTMQLSPLHPDYLRSLCRAALVAVADGAEVEYAAGSLGALFLDVILDHKGGKSPAIQVYDRLRKLE
jgi:hypothetical protein